VVGWPDPEQLARLDETEPNYRRLRLSCADYPLRLEGGGVLPAFDVYESRWGVLSDPAGPIPLPTQPELFERLGELGLEPWHSQAPATAAGTLASSGSLRAELRARFRSVGWVRESGLRPMS
jgi:hypothetical protein